MTRGSNLVKLRPKLGTKREVKVSKLSRVAIFLIQFYRNYLSKLKLPTCRHYPSCSEYALECFKIHRPLKAALLIFWRVLRCNPLGRGGFDPVNPVKNLSDGAGIYRHHKTQRQVRLWQRLQRCLVNIKGKIRERRLKTGSFAG